MKNYFYGIIAFLIFVASGCKKSEDVLLPVNPGYLLEVRTTDFIFGLHPVNDLNSGQAEMKDATEGLLSYYVADWNINGAIFSRDYSPDKFSKFKLTDGKMKVMQSLPIPGNFDANANVRIDNDQVWFVRSIDRDTVYWDIVNTTNMSYARSGKFKLPLKQGYKLKSGFASKRGADLIFGYQQLVDSAKGVADSVYIAILDGKEYAVKALDSDGRSAAAGFTYFSSSFTAENGDVYFLTFPFAYIGNNPSKPSAILRVKAGETKIDDEYFFNVTAKVNNNNLNGPSVYMGNNKMLVQIVREDLVKAGDYWGASPDGIFQNEYYVLDLNMQSATKLNVPLSRGNGDGNPIKISDNTFAFIVNGQDGNYVYTYNTSNGDVKQGIKYIGALVIYKLHHLK